MKILLTAEFDDGYIANLKEIGSVTIAGWAKGIGKLSEEELKNLSKDMDIIITSYDDITREVIDSAQNLKMIMCTRATPVNIDSHYAKSKGITVVYTPGRNSDSTAEHTIALMLSVTRRIPMAYQALKEGQFTGEDSKGTNTKKGLRDDIVWGFDENSPYVVFKGMELKGKTLGILGFGSIGKRVARLARGFGMNVLIYDPYVSEIDVNEIGMKKVNMDSLLQSSDFVSPHLKVTDATKGIINKETFKKMKNTAYFINCARAAIVNEEELIEALRTRKIAGAALDVFSMEPIPENHPFIKELDNVVITPHIAGATTDAIRNHTQMIIQELERFINKENLLYEYR